MYLVYGHCAPYMLKVRAVERSSNGVIPVLEYSQYDSTCLVFENEVFNPKIIKHHNHSAYNTRTAAALAAVDAPCCPFPLRSLSVSPLRQWSLDQVERTDNRAHAAVLLLLYSLYSSHPLRGALSTARPTVPDSCTAPGASLSGRAAGVRLISVVYSSRTLKVEACVG